MAWKQKDAADLTGEASILEGGGKGVNPACRRVGWGWGSAQNAQEGGGGVKLACRRTGESLHRMLAFF